MFLQRTLVYRTCMKSSLITVTQITDKGSWPLQFRHMTACCLIYAVEGERVLDRYSSVDTNLFVVYKQRTRVFCLKLIIF